MDNHCYYCNAEVAKRVDSESDRKLHLDHFVPQSKDGADELFNLVLACQPCNLKKSDKMPEDWAAQCHNEALLAVARLTWLIGSDAARAITSVIDDALEEVGHYCGECGQWHVSESLLPTLIEM